MRGAPEAHHEGMVVGTAGRRVVVRDAAGERACFLAGQRAVVGDRVLWVDAPGEGGKLTSVGDRDNALIRSDDRGREQVLAANLGGVFVICAREPPFRSGLLDRYLVAASVGGIPCAIVLNKVDLGVPDDIAQALAVRAGAGVPVHRVSTRTGEGLDALRAVLAASERPWALVGHSGTGKTSLAAVLVPDRDVGEIGHLSDYWGQGRHTTTHTRMFGVPTGGSLVDSPGIRTFAPGRVDAETVRDHFPGVSELRCKFRDCLHREGEAGCTADGAIDADLLGSYRRLLAEITRIDDRRRPGRTR